MNTIPKSASLRKAEDAKAAPVAPIPQGRPAKTYSPDSVFKIKKVKTYNDVVAVLQFRIESPTIELTGNVHKNEGIVIGVGPGLPSADGKRTPSQLEIGEVVSFYGNPISTIEPSAGIYADERIVMISERMVLCQLPSVKFEILEEVK